MSLRPAARSALILCLLGGTTACGDAPANTPDAAAPDAAQPDAAPPDATPGCPGTPAARPPRSSKPSRGRSTDGT